MKNLKLVHAVSLLMITCVACGGGTTAATSPAPTSAAPTTASQPPATSPPPTCSPSGTALQITAKNIAFDKDCLAAPANTAFTITFKNEDAGSTHNVEILDHPAGTSLFTGKIVTGPTTVTYKVKALPAGTYYFLCSVHHQMSGTFVVSA